MHHKMGYSRVGKAHKYLWVVAEHVKIYIRQQSYAVVPTYGTKYSLDFMVVKRLHKIICARLGISVYEIASP